MNPLNSKIDLSLSFNKLKTIIMAKATIKRVIDPTKENEGVFEVYRDGERAGIYSFKLNQSEDSVWNEKVNYESALRLALIIESGATKIEEIVYQTPETKEDLPPEVFEMPGI